MYTNVVYIYIYIYMAHSAEHGRAIQALLHIGSGLHLLAANKCFEFRTRGKISPDQ